VNKSLNERLRVNTTANVNKRRIIKSKELRDASKELSVQSKQLSELSEQLLRRAYTLERKS